ncbi:dual specificity protein phosphatase family protein [Kiloniella laminariae]|uniref:Dual specificity protein phosphatase family protein n=1 Tax=Kiloniella laminariae TaxID=454162 RepID=A0ABT4LJM3_9PROT|nr:dual specificity protein phosphatase family protein [Kiloniella laminariae]MCZ4281286.1 dual specificity protein phosphatase family protein [Kiloniella laminariae]
MASGKQNAVAGSLLFDARPAAVPLVKEKLLWTVNLGLFFFLLYGSVNYISLLRAPHPAVFAEWEKSIPFIPEFILPYMSSDLVFVVAFFLCQSRREIQVLGLRYGTAIVLSALFFLLLPLQFSFVRPSVTGWPAILFDLLSLDQPFNQFPSLHISLGFLAWQQISRQLKGIAFAAITLWFVLIGASTVLVFQHHMIDILGGVAVIPVLLWLVPDRGENRFFPLRFVTPRHLHMAFRYLVLSVGLTLLAFQLGWWGLVPGSAALSFIYVSVCYLLGFNGFLFKNSEGYPLLMYLLLWPYLIACWLNWWFWQGRVAPLSEIQPGLWLGGRPDNVIWQKLEGLGVTSVVDLVPELSSGAPGSFRFVHIPLLDIAIPAPEQLDRIVAQIADGLKGGSIYVHCALGMSRSVLAISAYLIQQGYSVEEALSLMDEKRPNRVRRPYIRIALELYRDYQAKGKSGTRPEEQKSEEIFS